LLEPDFAEESIESCFPSEENIYENKNEYEYEYEYEDAEYLYLDQIEIQGSHIWRIRFGLQVKFW